MKQIDSQTHNIRRKNNEAEKRSLVIARHFMTAQFTSTYFKVCIAEDDLSTYSEKHA